MPAYLTIRRKKVKSKLPKYHSETGDRSGGLIKLVDCYDCLSMMSACDDAGGHRNRRATSQCTRSKSQPVCPLLVVADYRFYRGMGGSNLQRTTSYLVSFSSVFSVVTDNNYC